MRAEKNPLSIEGHHWHEFKLTNDHGLTVSFLDFGGIITSIVTPNKLGTFENIVVGLDDYKGYLNNTHYLGALIGRVAGRINQSRFKLNGKTYPLTKNEAEHHLHGGPNGLHSIIWQVELFEAATYSRAILSHTSLDGEAGYPGNVNYKISYTLTNKNEFVIDYEAQANQDTILSLTNHAYFNLSGNLQENILNHEMKMNANEFVELDEALIPTGRILPVADTVFDFTNQKKIATGIDSRHPQLTQAGDGYDHCFIFDHNALGQVRVTEPNSGRMLTITTDQPAIVIYTANGVDDSLTLKENQSSKYIGICFETQSSPASLEHPDFPSIYLAADEQYRYRTIFQFSTLADENK